MREAREGTRWSERTKMERKTGVNEAEKNNESERERMERGSKGAR